MKRALFIIDPQNCFMDFADQEMPLPVPGALADMMRLAAYVRNDPYRFDAIYVSLDTHPEDHISHAIRWVDAADNNPDSFTLTFSTEYQSGKWFAANPDEQQKQGQYLEDLEATGRVHTIWPVHGQKGEFEHRVEAQLQGALNYWEEVTGNKVTYVEKGMHRDTEQFGIFAAAVPVPGAPETYLNRKLVDEVNQFDEVEFAGEAESHCAKDSIDQYLEAIPYADIKKVTVLRDTMSPVAAVIDPESGKIIVDFPAQGKDWVEGLPQRGVHVTTVAEQIAA